MRFLALICVALLLANCAATQKNAQRVNNMVKKETTLTTQKIKEYFQYPPAMQNPPKHEVQQAYCYKSQSDIVCFNAPLVGQEYRMIGYQGPKPDSFMDYHYTPQPVARPAVVMSSKGPVFVGAAPAIKEDTSGPKELIPNN